MLEEVLLESFERYAQIWSLGKQMQPENASPLLVANQTENKLNFHALRSHSKMIYQVK